MPEQIREVTTIARPSYGQISQNCQREGLQLNLLSATVSDMRSPKSN